MEFHPKGVEKGWKSLRGKGWKMESMAFAGEDALTQILSSMELQDYSSALEKQGIVTEKDLSYVTSPARLCF